MRKIPYVIRLNVDEKKKVEYCQATVSELTYLQACAAEWEAFAAMEGTDASLVVFMRQTVKKLAKMKGAG